MDMNQRLSALQILNEILGNPMISNDLRMELIKKVSELVKGL